MIKSSIFFEKVFNKIYFILIIVQSLEQFLICYTTILLNLLSIEVHKTKMILFKVFI